MVRFHLRETSRTGKSIETKQMGSCQGWEKERMGSDCVMGIGFSSKAMKCFRA